MDIEKLIKRLYCPQIHSCPMDGEYPSCSACQKMLVEDIATSLSTLRAENEKLRAELETVRAEKDAAVSDLRRLGDCATCIHDKLIGYDDKLCACCARGEKWEWRGPQKED